MYFHPAYLRAAGILIRRIRGEAPTPVTAAQINAECLHWHCDVTTMSKLGGSLGLFSPYGSLERLDPQAPRRLGILILAGQTPEEDLFTRAHELGHLILYLVRTKSNERHYGSIDIGQGEEDEGFCDWFARQLLLPSELLSSVSNESLRRLQTMHCVSDSTVILQLMEAGKFTKQPGILGEQVLCGKCGSSNLTFDASKRSGLYRGDNALCVTCLDYVRQFRLSGKEAGFLAYVSRYTAFWKQPVTNLPALR